MPLKTVTSATLETSPGHNTNIVGTLKPDLQVITIGQFKAVIDQVNAGQDAFNNKLKSIGTKKVKLLAVNRFNRLRVKLKDYLI